MNRYRVVAPRSDTARGPPRTDTKREGLNNLDEYILCIEQNKNKTFKTYKCVFVHSFDTKFVIFEPINKSEYKISRPNFTRALVSACVGEQSNKILTANNNRAAFRFFIFSQLSQTKDLSFLNMIQRRVSKI